MSGAQPSETVAFSFTDVEGSTRLWEEHPEEMRTALAPHDTILRDVIESHGGFVFATGGDRFAAAFNIPNHAVDAAIEGQQRLSDSDD